MEANCWVNVYRGLYFNCKDGAPYYISLGYATKEQAIKALDAPKSKSIMHRYITTIQLNF